MKFLKSFAHERNIRICDEEGKILQKFGTKWPSLALAKRYIWIKLIFFKGMHHFPPSRPPMNLISPFILR